MRSVTIRLLLAMVAVITFSQAFATTPSKCASSNHHSFDFWLGDWQVKTSDGKIAGNNHITSEYDGCVIHEHYTTPHGYSGESLNIYDVTRKLWHQSWVDSDGTLLTLEGGIRDGKMVMQGVLVDEHGKALQQRITWTPNVDSSVRQLWEAADSKGNWSVVFDGVYTRK